MFPGESGVDQLVEIIKVKVLMFIILLLEYVFFLSVASFCLWFFNLSVILCTVDFGNTYQRRNKVHESKLH